MKSLDRGFGDMVVAISLPGLGNVYLDSVEKKQVITEH